MSLNQPMLEAALSQVHLPSELASVATDTAFAVHVYDILPSTNNQLWELISQGATEGTVAIAQQQSAGRGQWGRQWHSAEGGLFCSIALTPSVAVAEAGQLMLCSTWGVAATLRNYQIPVQIKWFNDLVIGKQKLGGILLESRSHQGMINQAIVGVGINWANPIPETGINLKTILAEHNHTAISSLEVLAAIVLQGLMAGYRYWQQHGIDALLPSYQTLLARIGAPVSVSGVSGRVVGVDANGHLRVTLSESDSTHAVPFPPGAISLGYS